MLTKWEITIIQVGKKMVFLSLENATAVDHWYGSLLTVKKIHFFYLSSEFFVYYKKEKEVTAILICMICKTVSSVHLLFYSTLNLCDG